MGYIGNEPTTGHFPVDNFTSSGGSTYTLAKAPASAGAIEVSVQGVLQPTTAYTVSGTTLTMAGVTSGVKIFVRHLGETLSLPTPADGSVTAAKLGVNSVDGTKIAMGSDARGDILYHGATDYARLAKGTASQVLTMGANDPAWADAAGGAWTLINSGTASNVASLTISGLDTSVYSSFAIRVTDFIPITDGSSMRMRLGDSGGIDSGGSDYTWVLGKHASDSHTVAVNGSSGANAIIIDTWSGTATGENIAITCFLSCAASSLYPHLTFECSQVNAGTKAGYVTGAGTRSAAINVTQVQVFFDSGNISSGRMTVWGIKHT